jgi:hypothetical protein
VLDAEAMVLVRLCSSSTHEQTPNAVLGQCLIIIDSLKRIAVPDESDMIFSSHHLHSRSGLDVGLVKIGMRFRLPAALELNHVKSREYFEEEFMTEVC